MSQIQNLLQTLEQSDTIKEDEGRKALAFLSEYASKKVQSGLHEMTEAGIALEAVHHFSLWRFGGYKNFKAYMIEWCDHESLGRSTGWYMIDAIGLWRHLGRKPHDLLQITGGANAMRPVLEKNCRDRIIRDFNPDDGTIDLANGWESDLREQYPDAESPEDLVGLWIDDNLELEDTGRSVRRKLRDAREASKSNKPPDRLVFRPIVQTVNGFGKVPVNVSWEFKGQDGTKDQGNSIESMARRPHVMRAFWGLLGVKLENL